MLAVLSTTRNAARGLSEERARWVNDAVPDGLSTEDVVRDFTKRFEDPESRDIARAWPALVELLKGFWEAKERAHAVAVEVKEAEHVDSLKAKEEEHAAAMKAAVEAHGADASSALESAVAAKEAEHASALQAKEEEHAQAIAAKDEEVEAALAPSKAPRRPQRIQQRRYQRRPSLAVCLRSIANGLRALGRMTTAS